MVPVLDELQHSDDVPFIFRKEQVLCLCQLVFPYCFMLGRNPGCVDLCIFLLMVSNPEAVVEGIADNHPVVFGSVGAEDIIFSSVNLFSVTRYLPNTLVDGNKQSFVPESVEDLEEGLVWDELEVLFVQFGGIEDLSLVLQTE